MPPVFFTVSQKQRLIELDAPESLQAKQFEDAGARDACFLKLESELASHSRGRLEKLRTVTRRPALRLLEMELVEILNKLGFVEVLTPTLLSRGMLMRMGIGPHHPLWEQIYWLDKSHCLRPMLAPHLYHLMGRLARLWPMPIRFFEVGSCFRKESRGARHLSEFTMLNLVEMGMQEEPQERLESLARELMQGLGLQFDLQKEDSEVYGTTTDLLVDGLEVGSGAVGPHPLDAEWNVADDWAGLGLGLERLTVARERFGNIRRAGRSLSYLDGARLNV